MSEREEIKHESYGLIGFSRINGSARFYGSELQQDNYIEMKVYHSVVDRELSREWYHVDEHIPIIRLRMTSGQFAEMITSMNRGMGVPCTLESIQGKQIEKLPEIENRKEFVHRKFLDRMKEFAKTIRDKQTKVKEIVKKKTLSKEDVRELILHLEYLTQEISDNIPFFAKCFQETMDEVVYEAKLEVENAIQHKLTVLGMEKLEEIKTEHKQLKRTK
jgi:hypothetical protein